MLISKSSLEFLCQYLNILFIDCIYQTSRYYMPLFNIIASTICNKIFFTRIEVILRSKRDKFFINYLISILK